MIGGANENCGAVKPANFKKTTNRRALKDIKNYVGEANKRPLKKVICGNNHNIVPGRQVTTQFASISANKSQQSHEGTIENEKHNKPIIIDVNKPMAEESEAIVMEDLDTYDYMSNQLDINEKMRAILIDWLVEVHYKFKLREETLHLTVNIIDRFLSRQSVVRKKLQLVGVTALLLACKYEEVSVPAVDELVYVSDGAYTREEVLDMEKLVLKTLQFNISIQTPFVFLRKFLKAAEADKKLELLSSFIIELCLVEYQMLKFQPSLLAAAAIYTAQCSLKGFKCWTKTCQQHTMYGEDQLLECSKRMVDLRRNAASGKLTGVHRKYSTLKFGFVAKSEPAPFFLDTRV